MTREEFISQMGYRDDSPFKNEDSLDIKTGPNGIIDMSNTGTPLMANGKYLPPYSGNHKFEPNSTVTEVPLTEYQGKGEVLWQGTKSLFKPITNLFKPVPSLLPLNTTLSPSFKDLYTTNLPSYVTNPVKNADGSVFEPTGLTMQNFINYRKTSLNDWQNMIREENTKSSLDYGIKDNPFEIKAFNQGKIQTDKQGNVSEATLKQIFKNLKPLDRTIAEQTLNEFKTASKGTEGAIINEDDIPPLIQTEQGEFVGDLRINYKTPKISLDMFKKSMNEKLSTFEPILTKKYANYGLSKIGVKEEDLIQNWTVMLQANKLGGNIASGPNQNISVVNHFDDENIFGHLRIYQNKATPTQLNFVEVQNDETQNYHKIGSTINNLKRDNEYYARLINGEHESIAIDNFNEMWRRASTSSTEHSGEFGNLLPLGETGALNSKSSFPVVTNIPSGYQWGRNVQYWKKPYDEVFNSKLWDNKTIGKYGMPDKAFEENPSLIFHNFDEVLKFRQQFIDENVNYMGGDYFKKPEYAKGDNQIFADQMKENNLIMQDLHRESSWATDDIHIDKSQLLRNLQKRELWKKQRQRMFAEALNYAGQNGFKQLAWPTAETAAKVQNYPTIFDGTEHYDKWLLNPWTFPKETDFMKTMYALTTPANLKLNPVKQTGPFVFIDHSINYSENKGKVRKNSLMVLENSFQPKGQGLNPYIGEFQDAKIWLDIPDNIRALNTKFHPTEKQITAGLYHVTPDGEWNLIPTPNIPTPVSADDWNRNIIPVPLGDEALAWSREFSAGALDIPFKTYNFEKKAYNESPLNPVLNIRNQNFGLLKDPSIFDISHILQKGHRSVLTEYYKDFKRYLKEEPSLGRDYPFKLSEDGKFNVIEVDKKWRLGTQKRELKHGGEILPKYQDKGEVKVNYNDVEKGIRHVESLDGVLMKNKQSSASGLYGQLFDDIDYDGTRDEFIADTEYQKELFEKRYNGQIEGVPGLEINGIELYNEYKNQIDNFSLTPTQIAALSNMLGRQGTRNYLGKVLRDGESLEVGVPSAYGEGKPANKTPDEFFKLFNDSLIEKKMGGSINKEEVISDMLESGAFLPKFKMGSEMNIEGSQGKYNIKKRYDEEHRLPYIQFNSPTGKIENNKVYYDQDDINGDDNFNIIDIDTQEMQQDREHERIKSLIEKQDSGAPLSKLEKEYLTILGLSEEDPVQDKRYPFTKTIYKYGGDIIELKDINSKKHLFNKSNGNNNGISLAKQVEIYDAHINNIFNVDSTKSIAKNIYNKLNTLYYNDAKASKMSVFDYMKSLNN